MGVPAGIVEEISARGGRVTFARFMELALTHPVDGYYSRDEELIGPHGHFSTAPGLSPEFSRTMARLLGDLAGAALEEAGEVAATAPPGAGRGDRLVALVELGAGEGDLAGALLERWDTEHPTLRDRLAYTIVETGGPLRDRQKKALSEAMERGWQVSWAGTVGVALEPVDGGVVFGNEFLDAFPVHLVDVRGDEPLEAWVELVAGELSEVWAELSAAAEAELETVFGTVETAALGPLSRDGMIELRPAVGSLVERVAASASDACLLTVDYGEWFAAPGAGRGRGLGAGGAAGRRATASGGAGGPGTGLERPYARTVRGYFRHQLVDDPYLRVGRQDLTADVDFRALDAHGRRAGLETVFFITLADMLRADGGAQRLAGLRRRAAQATEDALDADRRAAILEKLLDYQGLGGTFKIMLQVKERGPSR